MDTDENKKIDRDFLIETVAWDYGVKADAEIVKASVHKVSDLKVRIEFGDNTIRVLSVIEGSEAECGKQLNLTGLFQDEAGKKEIIRQLKDAIEWCIKFVDRQGDILAEQLLNPDVFEKSTVTDVVTVLAIVYRCDNNRKLRSVEVIDGPPHVMAHIADGARFGSDKFIDVNQLMEYGYPITTVTVYEDISIDAWFDISGDDDD